MPPHDGEADGAPSPKRRKLDSEPSVFLSTMERRARSASRDTIELPDDSFWLKRQDLSVPNALEAINASRNKATAAMDWATYTTKWAELKGIVAKESDYLSGLSFVFTGHLPSLYRHSGEMIVQRFGGRVDSSVQRTTNFAVVGVQGSRGKLKDIAEFEIRTLDEDGLVSLIKDKLNIHSGQDVDKNKASNILMKLSRSRSSSSTGSSVASHSNRFQLELVEQQERQKHLSAVREVLQSVDNLMEAGIGSVSDLELRDVLLTLSKYSIDATKRLDPGILSYLRLNGIGRGITEKYHLAFAEGQKRNFDMSPFDGSQYKGPAAYVPRRSLNDEVMLDGHDNNAAVTATASENDAGHEHAGSNTPGQKSDQNHDAIDAEDHEMVASNAEHSVSHQRHSNEVSSHDDDQIESTDAVISTGPLPEEKDSPFWCKQCRRGPGVCTHLHKMIETLILRLSDLSLITLMFATFLIEKWDSNKQSEFGLSWWERKNNRGPANKQQRTKWLPMLKWELEKRRSIVPYQSLSEALEKLNRSIAVYKVTAQEIKLRTSQGLPTPSHQTNYSRKSSHEAADLNSQNKQNTVSENCLRGTSDQARLRGSRNSSARYPRDSAIDLENSDLINSSDTMSTSSEDSLLEAQGPSLGQLLKESPRETLLELASRLHTEASSIVLARMIHSICSEKESARSLVEETLGVSKAVAIEPAENDEMDQVLPSDAHTSHNLIDQIAGSDPILQTRECERCGSNFNPADPKDTCLYHNGHLTWISNGKPVNKDRLAVGFASSTSYTCCGQNRNSPGCKQGFHIPKRLEDVQSKLEKPTEEPSHFILPSHANRNIGDHNRQSSDSLSSSSENTSSTRHSIRRNPSQARTSFQPPQDYAPELPDWVSQDDNSIFNLVKEDFAKTWETNPISLDHDPYVQHLHPAERVFASRLRWDCAAYLEKKRKLFQAWHDNHQAGNPYTAQVFRRGVSGTHQKNIAFFRAYERLGMFNDNLLNGDLPPSTENGSNSATLATPKTPGFPSADTTQKKLSVGRSEYYKSLHNHASSTESHPLVRRPNWTATPQSTSNTPHRPVSTFSIGPLSSSWKRALQQAPLGSFGRKKQ